MNDCPSMNVYSCAQFGLENWIQTLFLHSAQVGCDAPLRHQMLDCLRARTASELATAAGETRIRRPYWRTKPWAPTVDGDFLTDDPKLLWESGQFAQIPVSQSQNHYPSKTWWSEFMWKSWQQSTHFPRMSLKIILKSPWNYECE